MGQITVESAEEISKKIKQGEPLVVNLPFLRDFTFLSVRSHAAWLVSQRGMGSRRHLSR
jgi:hypothetical protein